jgi:hypothetical protein
MALQVKLLAVHIPMFLEITTTKIKLPSTGMAEHMAERLPPRIRMHKMGEVMEERPLHRIHMRRIKELTVAMGKEDMGLHHLGLEGVDLGEADQAEVMVPHKVKTLAHKAVDMVLHNKIPMPLMLALLALQLADTVVLSQIANTRITRIIPAEPSLLNHKDNTLLTLLVL